MGSHPHAHLARCWPYVCPVSVAGAGCHLVLVLVLVLVPVLVLVIARCWLGAGHGLGRCQRYLALVFLWLSLRYPQAVLHARTSRCELHVAAGPASQVEADT